MTRSWSMPITIRNTQLLNVKKLKVIAGTSPLANFPVKCGCCNKMVWRFNMQDHHTRLHSDKTCPDIAKVSAAEKSLLMKKSKNTTNTLSAMCLKKLTDAEISLLSSTEFWDTAKKKRKGNAFGTFGKQHSARLKRLFGVKFWMESSMNDKYLPFPKTCITLQKKLDTPPSSKTS